MIDKELIAEWLGWRKTALGTWTLSTFGDCGDGVNGWGGVIECGPGALPQYDTDITLWHGPDGLLGEIEKRAEWFEFLAVLAYDLGCDMRTAGTGIDVGRYIWIVRRAEPAQLTAALVKMIEEAADDR